MNISPRPRLIILAAGGTIAMTGAAAPRLDAKALAAALPQLADIAEIEARDVLGKPSASLTLEDMALIASAALEAARAADGLVIAHGTDTLEETAFALALLAQTQTPIVLTAAMRRADQPGADGPANLLAAARVAVSQVARGKGILVVMDDEIHAAPLVRKAHSFRTHAFSSLPFGPIGYVAEDRVRFALQPAAAPPRLVYGGSEPVVPILEAGPGFERETLAALAAGAINGLVLSLPGAGHVAAGRRARPWPSRPAHPCRFRQPHGRRRDAARHLWLPRRRDRSHRARADPGARPRCAQGPHCAAAAAVRGRARSGHQGGFRRLLSCTGAGLLDPELLSVAVSYK